MCVSDYVASFFCTPVEMYEAKRKTVPLSSVSKYSLVIKSNMYIVSLMRLTDRPLGPFLALRL